MSACISWHSNINIDFVGLRLYVLFFNFVFNCSCLTRLILILFPHCALWTCHFVFVCGGVLFFFGDLAGLFTLLDVLSCVYLFLAL